MTDSQLLKRLRGAQADAEAIGREFADLLPPDTTITLREEVGADEPRGTMLKIRSGELELTGSLSPFIVEMLLDSTPTDQRRFFERLLLRHYARWSVGAFRGWRI